MTDIPIPANLKLNGGTQLLLDLAMVSGCDPTNRERIQHLLKLELENAYRRGVYEGVRRGADLTIHELKNRGILK